MGHGRTRVQLRLGPEYVILRLLPQERDDGDVLDPIDPIGREALGRLRERIEARVRGGAEVVRLRIDLARPPAAPVWPDDQLTRDWLSGIAEARAAADAVPDRWETAEGDAP